MSEGIPSQGPELYAQSGLDSTSLSTTIFSEDKSSNPFSQEAIYNDPDWVVGVKYDPGTFNPTPYFPYKPSLEKKPFPKRDEALIQETQLRQKARAHLPVQDRYRGYEDGLIPKIKGVVKRIFFIISNLSVTKGLAAYDLHLASQAKTLAFANYSAKPTQNFKVSITPRDPLMHALGIEDFGKEHRKMTFQSHWHKNGLQSYQFEEDGKTVTLHDTVTSSNDRTADGISMMRRVDNEHTGQSTAYTGRPDTQAKAKEQVTFIFRSEMAKGEDKRKGITFNEATGEYELTYVVNNLMSATHLTAIGGLNEKESILREQGILSKLKEMTIDGKKVKIKPIYFNQTFNFVNDYLSPPEQQEINRVGYESLLELAREGGDNPLLQAAISHLEHPEKLLPEEEFFYRDLICKILGLPAVDHCKSSTDRTIIAVAISMALDVWMNCKKEIPKKNPHEILADPIFKELFMANVMSGHQVTRVSRSAQGKVKGAEQFSQLIGFEWGGNGLKKNIIALRMVPERYKRKGSIPTHIQTTLRVLKFASFFFNSERIKNRIKYLERAYKTEEFDIDSHYIKNRRLFKPKGMKMHYKEGAVHPNNRVKKPSKTTVFKSFVEAVSATAFGIFGVVDAIVST